MVESNISGEIDRSPELKGIQVFGISGVTDANFREGFDPKTRIFNKSNTSMREIRYLDYCRIGDPEQIKLALNGSWIVRPKLSEQSRGVEITIDGSGQVWNLQESEALLNATGYPLLYQEQAFQQGKIIRPLLIVFPIGSHKVSAIEYKSDKAIGGDSSFCPDSDYSSGFGYHLEPGIVLVERVMEIQELDKDPSITHAQPFRLVDVTQEFI